MGALVSLFSFNVCFRFYFLFSPLARSVFGIAYFFLSVARLFSFFFSPLVVGVVRAGLYLSVSRVFFFFFLFCSLCVLFYA